MMGWVDDTSSFYDRISLYVQPSATEGFGLEILEAMAHGRLAIASEGAGAVDLALSRFPVGDVSRLAELIDSFKKDANNLRVMGERAREKAQDFTWDKVREMYKQVWRSM